MKHLQRVAVVGLTLALAGCGTNLGQRVTLADARATCLAWDGTMTVTDFNTMVLVLEALRDDGLPESTVMAGAYDFCDPNDAGCLECLTRLTAAVWN